MTSDMQHELIPREETLRLISMCQEIAAKLSDGAEEWELLDANGHIPASLRCSDLMQQAADAQPLSRYVIQMTAEFAEATHSTNRAGESLLTHLATAAALSSHAAPHFAETAKALPVLHGLSEGADKRTLGMRMIIDHATARSYLRRASESLRNAAEGLRGHLEFHRFFPAQDRQRAPAPPPPKPNGRHR